MSVLITGLQNRVKNSAAYAEELGLMLIANGEEMPYLLSPTGEKITAGITAPADAPTVADNGTGTLTNNEYAVYQIVYVGENAFPLVAAKIYSNPSPHSATFHINTGGVDRQNRISFDGVDDVLVTHVYLFRTSLQSTALLAETAADAGLLYYIGKVANAVGPLTIDDNTLANSGADQISLINFTTPQFRFVVWDGNYFWGWASHPFSAEATWETDGSFTLTNTAIDKFYGGRENQYLTFEGISTGGIDGRGTFLFKQTGDYTGQAVLEDGSDAALLVTNEGNITIIGESATLYRSGYRNPFQWGYLQNIAGLYVPVQWILKVSGSLGTAIAIVPDQQLLKLDMEFPANCVSFNLQGAATEAFADSKRQISRLYSVTSHFSQFQAIAKGRQVLWGMDYKNLAIVQCDGFTQVPVSGPISIILRQLSKNRSLHLLSHGTYDPVTEINAMWLSSGSVDATGSPCSFDLCVYQHAPTGFWGIFADYGILSSGAVEDPITSQRNILVGTETGFLAKAFDITTYGNFLPTNSPITGFIRSATANSITRSEGQDDFNPNDGGLIGNFCIIVDENGLRPQLVKISGVTFDTLTFNETLTYIPTTTDDPGLVDGQWKFFIGLIEINVLKYFDGGEPSTDKAPREYWATLVDAENPQIQFHPEHAPQPTLAVALQQDDDLDSWFTKEKLPTKKGKTYGLSLVERSYNPTQFFNFTVK